MHNANLLSPGIEKIVRESETYYTLGATLETPPKGNDGYRIELVSARKDLEIRIRRRFVPRTEEDAARKENDSALLFGVRSADLPVSFVLGPAAPKKFLSRERTIPFDVRVRIDQLAFEESGDTVEAAVELTFSSARPDGAKSDPFSIRVPLWADLSEWKKKVPGVWTHSGQFLAQKGDLRFVVTVRDLKSGRIGSAEASVHIE